MNDSVPVTRRTALLSLAAAAGMSMAFCSRQRARLSLTFVLVHGAWHGGWCWKKVAPLLRADGHQVYTPTLTGLGERRHLASPQVNLSTHIQDVGALLEFEDLHDVVLVGHSYAGFVIAGVAAQARARLGHLIFLDAFLPEDGKRMTDYNPEGLNEVVQRQGDGWRLPLPFPLAELGVSDPADVAWETPRITDQPFATFTEPLKLPADSLVGLRRSYLLTTHGEPFEPAATRATAAGFNVSAMTDAGHMVMVTRPRELAARLVELSS
jgi:pimeloyl-ACP methyl ester carboxylesterase